MNGGRLCIIITNAWLGTDWGDDDAIVATFGLGIDRQRIYDALLSLAEIRRTALE